MQRAGRFNPNSEVEMGSARAARAVFRALAENAERTEKFQTFGRRSGAKRVDARRVQPHPRRVCSPTSVFEFKSNRCGPGKDHAPSGGAAPDPIARPVLRLFLRGKPRVAAAARRPTD